MSEKIQDNRTVFQPGSEEAFWDFWLTAGQFIRDTISNGMPVEICSQTFGRQEGDDVRILGTNWSVRTGDQMGKES